MVDVDEENGPSFFDLHHLFSCDKYILMLLNRAEPGPIEKLQAAVVENVNLYADKYEEEFQPHLPAFTTAIWGLLMKVCGGYILISIFLHIPSYRVPPFMRISFFPGGAFAQV